MIHPETRTLVTLFTFLKILSVYPLCRELTTQTSTMGYLALASVHVDVQAKQL